MLGYDADRVLPDKYLLEKGKDKMGWRGRGSSSVFSFPSCLLEHLDRARAAVMGVICRVRRAAGRTAHPSPLHIAVFSEPASKRLPFQRALKISNVRERKDQQAGHSFPMNHPAIS